MLNSVSLASLRSSTPAALPSRLANAGGAGDDSVEKARDLKKAFSQFVGETFYGEMLKAMRQSAGEPAYFHGGMAEEQFQSRLDMQRAQDLAGSENNAFAEGMFAQQFPDEARLLEANQPQAGLADLGALRRR
jgi:Rod binding domain-containing protein